MMSSACLWYICLASTFSMDVMTSPRCRCPSDTPPTKTCNHSIAIAAQPQHNSTLGVCSTCWHSVSNDISTSHFAATDHESYKFRRIRKQHISFWCKIGHERQCASHVLQAYVNTQWRIKGNMPVRIPTARLKSYSLNCCLTGWRSNPREFQMQNSFKLNCQRIILVKSIVQLKYACSMKRSAIVNPHLHP